MALNVSETEDVEKNDFLRSFIGKAIVSVRSEKNISQLLLAQEAGISQSQLSDIERGRFSPTFTTIYKICQALGVNFGDFLFKATYELENEDLREDFTIAELQPKLANVKHQLLNDRLKKYEKKLISQQLLGLPVN